MVFSHIFTPYICIIFVFDWIITKTRLRSKGMIGWLTERLTDWLIDWMKLWCLKIVVFFHYFLIFSLIIFVFELIITKTRLRSKVFSLVIFLTMFYSLTLSFQRSYCDYLCRPFQFLSLIRKQEEIHKIGYIIKWRHIPQAKKS